jgi:hypothetical protein
VQQQLTRFSAPTLIIVRVGLGVSTDDVDRCVTISRGTSGGTSLPDFAAPSRRLDTALELQVRVTREEEEFVGSVNDTKLPRINYSPV